MRDNATVPAMLDPFRDIRLLTLHATRGANYWSRQPVIRLDVALGAYEDCSSADVPGCTEQLLAALPMLMEHRCSVGVPGGFVQRLRAGTYAGHIAEHVALELQCLIGDTVGFGQTRGTGVVGEYTIVFEHRHEQVGLRAAACALDIVQHAFAGTLLSNDGRQDAVSHDVSSHATPRRTVPMIGRMLAELRALRCMPDVVPAGQMVHCAVTGGRGRAALCDELSHRTFTHRGVRGTDMRVIDVAPSYILHAGLPYARANVAVILDATLIDVPIRYRDPERAARLVATVADAVAPGGAVICPSDAHYVHDYIRAAGATAIKFSPSIDVHEHVHRAAAAVAEWQRTGADVSSPPFRSHGAA